jgi:hypothetical protein
LGGGGKGMLSLQPWRNKNVSYTSISIENNIYNGNTLNKKVN